MVPNLAYIHTVVSVSGTRLPSAKIRRQLSVLILINNLVESIKIFFHPLVWVNPSRLHLYNSWFVYFPVMTLTLMSNWLTLRLSVPSSSWLSSAFLRPSPRSRVFHPPPCVAHLFLCLRVCVCVRASRHYDFTNGSALDSAWLMTRAKAETRGKLEKRR